MFEHDLHYLLLLQLETPQPALVESRLKYILRRITRRSELKIKLQQTFNRMFSSPTWTSGFESYSISSCDHLTSFWQLLLGLTESWTDFALIALQYSPYFGRAKKRGEAGLELVLKGGRGEEAHKADPLLPNQFVALDRQRGGSRPAKMTDGRGGWKTKPHSTKIHGFLPWPSNIFIKQIYFCDILHVWHFWHLWHFCVCQVWQQIAAQGFEKKP